jgi:hypothetical protein
VATDVLGDPSTEPDRHALIAEEPALQRRLTEAELDTALEAVADFTELRSPSRAGHSRGVESSLTAPCPSTERPCTSSSAGQKTVL